MGRIGTFAVQVRQHVWTPFSGTVGGKSETVSEKSSFLAGVHL